MLVTIVGRKYVLAGYQAWNTAVEAVRYRDSNFGIAWCSGVVAGVEGGVVVDGVNESATGGKRGRVKYTVAQHSHVRHRIITSVLTVALNVLPTVSIDPRHNQC